jgi:phage terminase large subunit GpA-like protein
MPAEAMRMDDGFSPAVLQRIARALQPDPLLTVDAWADAHRVLPPVGSAKPGPWRTSRAPYMRLVMEALSPSSPYETVVLMASAQTGKTECALNLIGYTIDQAPGPVLAIQPTVQLAERFSRQRIEAMIRATPRLQGRVSTPRSRDSGNTLLSKEFPNGILVLAGANSGAGLRSMPAQIVIADEVDAYPASVDGEGDPIELARARTETYVRSKTFLASTPLTAGASRIEMALSQCERQAEYHVPCPHCGHRQPLVFARLKWPAGAPLEATYQCAGCEQQIEHRHKPAMIRAGAWIFTRDRGTRSIGFRINQLYSTIGKTTWGLVAEKYERAKESPELMRTFHNTVLGLPYAEPADAPPWEPLFQRRESYAVGTVQPGCRFLTMAVDVQENRLEVEIVGWGRDLRSWSLLYRVLVGDPLGDQVWVELDGLLAPDYPTAAGDGALPIWCCAVDSGKYPQRVYAWARRHPMPSFAGGSVAVKQPRTAMVVKGRDVWARVLLAPDKASQEERQRGLKVVGVGVSGLKRELYQWLRQRIGPDGKEPHGYLHWPTAYDERYFKGLVAERLVVTMVGGKPREVWELPGGTRNEPLDLRVYNRAAAAACGIDRLLPRDWTRLEQRLPPSLLRAGSAMSIPLPQDGVHPAPEPPAVPAPQPDRARSRFRIRTVQSPWMRH